MPKKALISLLISTISHVAILFALNNQKPEIRESHMGSVQAPVSLRFSTVTRPSPATVVPIMEELPSKSEPKAEKKPKKNAKQILPKKELKPVKQKQAKVAETLEAVTRESEVAEWPTEKTVKQKIPTPGLSNEPVMVSEPKIRTWVEPRYPRSAQRRNQQGVVLLNVIVDERGNPSKVSVLESSGYPLLDKAAIDAVNRWSFKPEQRNEAFVKSRVHIPVAFEIR